VHSTMGGLPEVRAQGDLMIFKLRLPPLNSTFWEHHIHGQMVFLSLNVSFHETHDYFVKINLNSVDRL
jgi:hypothetical protein